MKSILWLTAILGFAVLQPGYLVAQPTSTGNVDHAGHSHSQPGVGTDQVSKVIDVTPESPEFKEATGNLRKILRQLLELELRFHNSSTTEEEKRYRKQWYEMRENIWEPHRAMLHAGLAEYVASPEKKQQLADFLFNSLKRNVETDCYEGMLPVARALYENKYPSPAVPGLFALCCLADNEFEQARQPLGELIESGQAQPELQDIYENLDSLSAAWKEELNFQQADAAGPPLPQARILTSKGTVVVELFENQAPVAVANFVALAEKGFYDNMPLFLVLTNLLAQTGCPKGDGTGGPGYFIPAESDDLPKRRVFRGSVALNLLPDLPDSGGSQFMISYLPLSRLENDCRVFGRVISGMPNVARFNRIDPTAEKKKDDKPVELDKIVSIEITGKRNHPYEPDRIAQPFRGDPPPFLTPGGTVPPPIAQ